MDKKAYDTFIIKSKNFGTGMQMHYRPDSILEMDDVEVLLDGVEGSTNTKLTMMIARSTFDSLLKAEPTSRFLIDEWNKKEKNKNKNKNNEEMQINHEY